MIFIYAHSQSTVGLFFRIGLYPCLKSEIPANALDAVCSSSSFKETSIGGFDSHSANEGVEGSLSRGAMMTTPDRLEADFFFFLEGLYPGLMSEIQANNLES